MAVVACLRMKSAPQAYHGRPLTEGHTTKKNCRCLKRHLAAEIDRNLTAVTRADEALAFVTSAISILA